MPVTLPPFLLHDPANPLMFHRGEFLAWFTVVMLGVVLLQPWRRARTAWLTAFSLFVYYRIAGAFVGLLVLTILLDYVLARGIDASRRGWIRRGLLATSILTNLGILGWFKYSGLLAQTLEQLVAVPWHPGAWILPAGISFYTFQSLSYTVDVYRRAIPASRSLLDYTFFVSFFPQLVAGPIVRAASFLPQIVSAALPSRRVLGMAVGLFALGILKKTLVADPLAVLLVDPVFAEPARYQPVEQLLAVYGYAIQIYADFSGYSDMAIGLAALLGFVIPPNFDRPYTASSITDFWRRWHISLSTWLRDYLYVPLGGNRRGRVRTYLNLCLVMLLGGMWHGAAWRFGLWGGWHGLLLALERATGYAAWVAASRWRAAVGGVLTFHLVCLGWVFFRAESVTAGLGLLESIAGIVRAPDLAAAFMPLGAQLGAAVLCAGALAVHLTPTTWRTQALRLVAASGVLAQAALLVLLVWAAAAVGQLSSGRPFIYFRF